MRNIFTLLFSWVTIGPWALQQRLARSFFVMSCLKMIQTFLVLASFIVHWLLHFVHLSHKHKNYCNQEMDQKHFWKVTETVYVAGQIVSHHKILVKQNKQLTWAIKWSESKISSDRSIIMMSALAPSWLQYYNMQANQEVTDDDIISSCSNILIKSKCSINPS